MLTLIKRMSEWIALKCKIWMKKHTGSAAGQRGDLLGNWISSFRGVCRMPVCQSREPTGASSHNLSYYLVHKGFSVYISLGSNDITH